MIEELLNKYLEKEIKKEDKRVRSGKWSPSSFGRCYRYQYWNRMNEKHSNPVDVYAMKTFALGNLIGGYIQGIISGQVLSVIESNISTVDCEAYADIELQDEIVELKTIHPFGFKQLKKKDFDITQSKIHNILQCMYYAIKLTKNKGRLVYISKDTMEIKEFVFDTVDWINRVDEELRILNSFWKQKKLPPAMARLSWDCNYCNFKNKCKGGEGSDVKG
tara:strand:+ start:542 stop:1198 length:657 start_codon:yes stop_codon:yes gene_type:complete